MSSSLAAKIKMADIFTGLRLRTSNCTWPPERLLHREGFCPPPPQNRTKLRMIQSCVPIYIMPLASHTVSIFRLGLVVKRKVKHLKGKKNTKVSLGLGPMVYLVLFHFEFCQILRGGGQNPSICRTHSILLINIQSGEY